MLPHLIYISIQTMTPFWMEPEKGFLPLCGPPCRAGEPYAKLNFCCSQRCESWSPYRDGEVERRHNLRHAFTHHYIANVMCCRPLNARFSQRRLINAPNCQTIQFSSWRAKVPSVLLIFKIRSQLNKKTIVCGQGKWPKMVNWSFPALVPTPVKYGWGHK